MSASGIALASLLRDARLAPLAVSPLPAWLWTLDATRILWANPAGAAIFGAATSVAISARRFDAAQRASAQVAELATRLPENGAPQIERLHGFDADDAHAAHLCLLAHPASW